MNFIYQNILIIQGRGNPAPTIYLYIYFVCITKKPPLGGFLFVSVRARSPRPLTNGLINQTPTNYFSDSTAACAAANLAIGTR